MKLKLILVVTLVSAPLMQAMNLIPEMCGAQCGWWCDKESGSDAPLYPAPERFAGLNEQTTDCQRGLRGLSIPFFKCPDCGGGTPPCNGGPRTIQGVQVPGWTLAESVDSKGRPILTCESSDPVVVVKRYTYPEQVKGTYKNRCRDCRIEGNVMKCACWVKNAKAWQQKELNVDAVGSRPIKFIDNGLFVYEDGQGEPVDAGALLQMIFPPR